MERRQLCQGKREDRCRRLCYGVFCVLVFLTHLPWKIIHDDIIFREWMREDSIAELFYHFYTFNGKILTDLFACILTAMPFVLWKLMNALVFTGIAALIVCIFTDNTPRDVAAVCLLMLLFPYGQYLGTAGYICVSTNYIYTTLCLLLLMLPLKRLARGQQLQLWWYPAALPLMAYAANQEQGSACLVGLFAVFFLWLLVSKAPRKQWLAALVLLGMAVCCFAFMFFLPGRQARMERPTEMELYLPEFAHWSFAKKVYRGYSSTVAHILFGGVDILAVFCLLLLITAVSRGNKWDIAIAAIPAGILTLIHLIGSDWLVYKVYVHMTDLHSLSSGFPGILALGVSLLMLGCIVVSVWRAAESAANRGIMLGALLIGGGSRLMMGFSATIYASAERTFTYLVFCLTLCCVILLGQLRKHDDRTCWKAGMAAVVMSLLL